MVKRDGGFHPAQCSAETTVDAIAECEVPRSRVAPVDVENVGVGEDFRVMEPPAAMSTACHLHHVVARPSSRSGRPRR
jgi:hypothetical protein